MTTEGLVLQPDGDRRWSIVEAQRPGDEGVLAIASGDDGDVRVEPGPGAGAFGTPPAGPYASAQQALEAVGTWRLARWNADR